MNSYTCSNCKLTLWGPTTPPYCPQCGQSVIKDTVSKFPEIDLTDKAKSLNYVGPTGKICQTLCKIATAETPAKLRIKIEGVELEKCGKQATYQVGEFQVCDEHYASMISAGFSGGAMKA